MIPQALDKITIADIQNLLDQKVVESKTLEYKRELPGGKDQDCIHFLKAVSAIANTDGGDLIYGIKSDNGIPIEIQGIPSIDEDKVKLRLSQLCQSGLAPRVTKLEMKYVPISRDNSVLIIRLGKSLNSPHRVIHSGHNNFYARNSAGSYPLDVNELRDAFKLSGDIPERIRAFIINRLIQIDSNQAPLPIMEAGKVVMHVVPLASFTDKNSIIFNFQELHNPGFHTLSGSFNFSLRNLEGAIYYDQYDGQIEAYTQVFRNGIIESAYALRVQEGETLNFNGEYLEQKIQQSLINYLDTLYKYGLLAPYYIFISFIDIKGYKMTSQTRYLLSRRAATQNRLGFTLPELVLDTHNFDLKQGLNPIFNLMWNAFGHPAIHSEENT
ncbi:ATP-binding protein [Methylobacillus sp.]|uniref:AlbA family DNA-binding domain-containing protein n=1 Tax=Methylobacillus sp. TaxID=56818 RepID=UPI0012CAE063|nr:ATP-binding protein [Methylobacillus sp.]MPS49387.1 ATP-binding protein [Methylobacillus sp.]